MCVTPRELADKGRHQSVTASGHGHCCSSPGSSIREADSTLGRLSHERSSSSQGHRLPTCYLVRSSRPFQVLLWSVSYSWRNSSSTGTRPHPGSGEPGQGPAFFLSHCWASGTVTVLIFSKAWHYLSTLNFILKASSLQDEQRRQSLHSVLSTQPSTSNPVLAGALSVTKGSHEVKTQPFPQPVALPFRIDGIPSNVSRSDLGCVWPSRHEHRYR